MHTTKYMHAVRHTGNDTSYTLSGRHIYTGNNPGTHTHAYIHADRLTPIGTQGCMHTYINTYTHKHTGIHTDKLTGI